MKRAVWKYNLTQNVTELNIPVPATPIACKVQNGKPVIYFEVAPESNLVQGRKIILRCTGELFDPNPSAFVGPAAIYLDTILLDDDGYVLHCYVV